MNSHITHITSFIALLFVAALPMAQETGDSGADGSPSREEESSVQDAGSQAGGRASGPVAPDETEIVVPELVLEVEELELQQVRGVLPEEGELALGQVAIPLPGSDDLAVDEGVFDVPQPGMTVQQDVESIFSSGRLGAGSVNHVVGEVSLFRLGIDPRFRFRFSYEGLDGYQFNEPGAGFFSTSNALDGWLSLGDDELSVEAEGAFSEDVHGLQGESQYYSTGLRRTSGSGALTFRPDPLIRLDGELDALVATRTQSLSGTAAAGTGVPRDQEISVTPAADLTVSIDAVDLVLSSSYFLRLLTTGDDLHQDVDAVAGIDVDLPAPWSASARAGVQWAPARGLAYPWSLSLELLLGEAFETSLAGGYRIERLALGDLWTRVPPAAVSPAAGPRAELVNDRQWYGNLTARWSGVGGLSLTADAEFTAHDAVVDIGSYDSATSLYSFEQRAMMSLQTSAQASWRPSPQVQAQAGWRGVFVDSVTGTPTNAVEGSLRVSDAEERLSAAAEARSEFFPEPSMPWLGLSGSFALSEEIEFTLEVSDVLAPLLENGRATIGPTVRDGFPFIEPGFRASLFTTITL